MVGWISAVVLTILFALRFFPDEHIVSRSLSPDGDFELVMKLETFPVSTSIPVNKIYIARVGWRAYFPGGTKLICSYIPTVDSDDFSGKVVWQDSSHVDIKLPKRLEYYLSNRVDSTSFPKITIEREAG